MARKDLGIENNSQRQIAQDQLGAAMAKALQDSTFPDLKAIICSFTRRVGGADGVAKMLLREYRDAKSGSMIRSMILQMILQGSKILSAKEQSRDASMISDDDLEKEVSTLIDKAQKAGQYAGEFTAKTKSGEAEGVG